MKNVLSAVLMGSILALPAQAADTMREKDSAKDSMVRDSVTPPMRCTNQEHVTISINFNIRAKSYADAKSKYDEKVQQIDDFAKQQNVKKFTLQSMNYNISSQQSGFDDATSPAGYQLTGNASYLLDSADVAFKLGEFLAQQNIKANVNVSKYRSGLCDDSNKSM